MADREVPTIFDDLDPYWWGDESVMDSKDNKWETCWKRKSSNKKIFDNRKQYGGCQATMHGIVRTKVYESHKR